MFPEPEITTLYVDHGKRQSGALKYPLGISKVLVFLGSLAELLIRMLNSVVVFFAQVTYIFSHFSELRSTVLSSKEEGRKGKREKGQNYPQFSMANPSRKMFS